MINLYVMYFFVSVCGGRGPAYTLVDTLQFKGLSNITGHLFPLMILVLHAWEEEMGRKRGMVSQKITIPLQSVTFHSL